LATPSPNRNRFSAACCPFFLLAPLVEHQLVRLAGVVGMIAGLMAWDRCS